MKRSDMVLNIASTIVMHDITITFDKAQEMAEIILERIEKEGMLPPEIKCTDPGHFEGDSFKYEINEWENE
jgi:hypothetical protein